MTTAIAAPRSGGRRRTLYFVRHGETDWNRVARLQGQQDVALNDLGRRQAGEAAQHLRDLIGAQANELPWIVSPMARTMETMRIMRRSLGLPDHGWRSEERLRELSFGQWEGLTWKEVRKADPPGAALRTADKWGFTPPGGESYATLLERIRPVIEGLSGDAIMVAHGGVARAALVLLTGMEPAAATMEDIWQGRVLVFEAGGFFWVP
jgi:broad specificity phosphatase PhoE